MRTTSTSTAGFYVILVVCVCACYASDAGTWEVISSSMQPSMLVDASVYSDSPRNRILYFGGTGNTISNISSALWSFDTISSSWVEINSSIAPAQRKGHSAVGYGGKMYVFGGFNTDQPFNDMWAFDLEENTWTQVQYADDNNMPYPRNDHFAATIGDEMWIFGGLYDYITALTDVWSFNFLSSSWRMITPVINCPREGNSHIIDDGGMMRGMYYPSLNSVILYLVYPGLYEYHLDTNNCESLNISGAVLAPYVDVTTPSFALSSTISISNPILYIFCEFPISWDFYTYSNFYAFDYDRKYMAALPQFEYPDQTTVQVQDMTIVSLNNTVYVSSYITDGSGNLQVAQYTPGCQNQACSGNGECIADAYCQCYNSSVGGYDCSAECLGSCGSGFCDYTYTQDNTSDPICKCPINVLGDTCNITCPNCQNGICEIELGSNIATCSCDQAYFGELCNETCPGQCNFHGTCNANLTCTCRDFWSGIDCMTDTRVCRVPQLACIENNTAPMSDLSWCSNQNVFIAPIKFQPTNASISSNITMACANSSDPMSTCKSIVQVCTAVAPSTTTTPHDEYVLMGLDTGDVLIFDFNTEVILGELTLGNSSIEYLAGDFVNVIIAADENQFNVWQIFDNVSISLAIEQTWAQDPSISADDVLVSVNSFVSNYVPVFIPEAVVFQAIVASMFQNSQTGKYQLQYRQFIGTNFASIHPDKLIRPMNISTWSIESSLEFNSLNFYFTTQYSVGAPYSADSPACYCGSQSRDLVIIYSESHIATNRAPNSTLLEGTYTLPFEAENAVYTAPPGYTITSVADFSSCCSNFNLPSEIRYLVVGLYSADTAESRVDLYPLNELSYYDFSCYYEFDPNTPQLGLMVMRDSQGQCKDYFQNCNNSNTLYFNGSQCVPRDIDSLPTTVVPENINIAYVGNPSGSAVDPTDFANYFDTVTNSTISSMMQSFGYNSIFITDTQQSVEVFGVQPASCGGDLNIKQMNNLEVASPIVDFWVTPNGQHVFIAAAKSNWELSSRLKLVEICEKLKNGDTSPFVLQYESYCIAPLGPPQPLGFGDFLLFVSMCNSGRYCPSFSSNTVNLVGPGNYTLMPGKVGPCIPQYYCPEGTLKECPIGYKCPEYGMMLPMKCARNQYQNTTCSQTGLENEVPCPNGAICLTMDSPPIMVAPGYYVSESDPLAPGTPCQLGQFCPLGASAPPPLCPAGFYCPNASLTEPVPCPTMYDAQGNQVNNKTSYCPAGTFIPQLCPAGNYCTLPNQMSNCSNGDYCPEGTQVAQPCPAGSVCETPSTISKCPHNHVCPGGTYVPQKCSIFEYCPKGSSAQRQWTILAGELVILLLIFIGFRIYSVCVRQRHDRKASELIFDSHKSTNRFKKPTPRESDALLSISNKWQQSGFLIQFENLSLTLGKDKQVLKGVSGTFIPGRLTAIMGPSGAGKTTLLQVLSGRVKHTGGSLLINGKPDGMEQYKTVFGFVPQEDIMLRSLTVKEILEFSTATRLPPSISKKERTMLIMDILDVLGLSHVRYSPIGDDEQRGVSGGERKRVNIGMELAAEPAVLFLDEPTSGLDSTSATQVMQCLKNVAEMGITVVCVIHQPRVEVFEMIDNVLLLGVGGVSVYQGEAAKAINYFNDVLHFAPKKNSTNPADYLMDAICNKIPRSETEPIEQVWRSNLQASVPVINNSFVSFKPRKMPNPLWQLILFMHRSGSLIVRDMYSVILNIVLVFVSGLLAGFIKRYSSNSGFIGPMSADEQARCPGPMQKVCELPLNDSYVIQFCLLNMAAGMTAVASSLRHFGDERVIYWREATTGTSSLAYFIGKNIASIPLMIICPFILISVYYMLVALQHNFWHMYFVLLLTQFTCVGAGHLISLIISPQNSLLAGVVYVIVSTLFCGANPALSKLNSYGIPAKILTSLSYSRWSTEGLYILALRPFENVYNLDSAFDFWGYKRDFLMKDMLGLMALGIFFRILAFLALLIFHKYRKAK